MGVGIFDKFKEAINGKMELNEWIDKAVKRELENLERLNEKRYTETKKIIEEIRKLLEK